MSGWLNRLEFGFGNAVPRTPRETGHAARTNSLLKRASCLSKEGPSLASARVIESFKDRRFGTLT